MDEYSKYFYLMADLCQLYRSTASLLPRSADPNDILDMSTHSRAYSVRTAELELKSTEKAEYQILHQLAAEYVLSKLRERVPLTIYSAYDQVVRSSMADEDGSRHTPIPRPKGTPAGTKKLKTNTIYPTAALRDLSLLSFSILLSRFNHFVVGAGKKTLVNSLQGYRQKDFGGDWFINAVHRRGDLPISNRMEKLTFLCYGSPTLRYLFYLINKHVLSSAKKKLLITEATPLTAWFIETALRFAHINATTMHAGLSQDQRQEVTKKFQNPASELEVMIIMYDVSAQGLNLHQACHVAFVGTAARNAALEAQAWGRVIRVRPPTSQHCEGTVLTSLRSCRKRTWRSSGRLSTILMIFI